MSVLKTYLLLNQHFSTVLIWLYFRRNWFMCQEKIKNKNIYKTCKDCKKTKHYSLFTLQPSGGHFKKFCKECEIIRNEKKSVQDSLLKENKKQCLKCNEIKPFTDFHKSKGKLAGYMPKCKVCEVERRRAKYLKYKDRELSRNRKYAQSHKEQTKIWKRHYERNRRHTDINYNIKSRMTCGIRYALQNQSKFTKTINLLGCSIENLRIYLESKFQPGMTWENYGKNGWHIDHIIPSELFDFSNPQHQKACFHHTNLQPLWEIDNIKKQDFLPNGKQARFLTPEEKRACLIELGFDYLFSPQVL